MDAIRFGGALGNAREINGLLVLTDTRRNHLAVANLLAEMRRHGPGPAPPAQETVWSEAMFTSEGQVTSWVLDLLAKAREGKLSEFSSVVTVKVGGRLFARIGGLWLDAGLSKGSHIVLVAAGTPAQEAMLGANPTLREFFALGPHVVVAVDAGLAVSLDTVGISRRDDADLTSLVEALRKLAR